MKINVIIDIHVRRVEAADGWDSDCTSSATQCFRVPTNWALRRRREKQRLVEVGKVKVVAVLN
jgi:hypothetical protein